MNEQLIKFIELCLEDGVISDKEREVIFRKSKELGVPDDECEILLNSLVSKHSKGSNQPDTPKKKGGFFSSMFNEIKKNIDTDSIKSSLNQVKTEIKKNIDTDSIQSRLNQVKDDFQKGMDNSIGEGPSIQNSKKVTKEKKHSIVEGSINESNTKDSMEINIDSLLESDNSLKDERKLFEQIKEKFCETNYFVDKNGLLNILKPRLFNSTIWNTQVREKLSSVNLDGPGELELENHYSRGTFEFGIVNESEGILFFKNDDNFGNKYKIGIVGGNRNVISSQTTQRNLNSKGSSIFELKKVFIELGFNEFFENGYKNFEGNHYSYDNKTKKIIVTRTKDYHNPFELELTFNSEVISKTLNYISQELTSYHEDRKKKREKKILNRQVEQEKKVEEVKNNLISEFDKDNNGQIDLFQGDDEFMLLFRKNQEFIQTKGDDYVKNFVKISTYLNTKRDNINEIYNEIINHKVDSSYGVKKRNSEIFKKGDDNYLNQFDISVGLFKNQIHLWNLLFLHSTNMIVSLLEDDKITFYEIYEKLDKLNIFNSNWENEVSERLKNMEEGIGVLIHSIHKMESNIISELQNMTYLTNESLNKLNDSVSKSLNEVNRQLSVQTMWSIVNTYQVYKINKNTKSLRE